MYLLQKVQISQSRQCRAEVPVGPGLATRQVAPQPLIRRHVVDHPAGERAALGATQTASQDQAQPEHHDHSGSASHRNVEPHRLVNWERRWYLVTWDVDRRDWRTFRVDRIGLRSPNGPRFTPRELPEEDMAAYVSRRVSATAWKYTARVIVHAPAEVVVGRIDPAVGTVQPVDDRTSVLVTGADAIETIAVSIGLLGIDFSVSDPPELVAYLREVSARYARATSA